MKHLGFIFKDEFPLHLLPSKEVAKGVSYNFFPFYFFSLLFLTIYN